MSRPKPLFDHERLNACSIEFVAWSSQVLDNLPVKLAVCDPLDRASTSIPLKIAEGNGKFTPAEGEAETLIDHRLSESFRATARASQAPFIRIVRFADRHALRQPGHRAQSYQPSLDPHPEPG